MKELETLTEKLNDKLEELNDVVDSFDEIDYFQNDLKELAKSKSLKELLSEINKRIDEYSESSYLVGNYLTLYYLLTNYYYIFTCS